MKKVLILSGSPRRGGNSDLLCDEFARGARQSGNAVEKIFVAEKNIGYCRGCYACRNHGVCVFDDGMSEILQKIIDCDVLVLASPVYFYSVSAQLKAVIDRTVARWTEIKNKDMYYITASAEDSVTVADGTLAAFRGFADCISGSRECGVICGKGVYEKGEVLNNPAMRKAFEAGASIK